MISEKTCRKITALFERVEAEYNENIRLTMQHQLKKTVAGIKQDTLKIKNICGNNDTRVLHLDYINHINERCEEIEQLTNELSNNFMLFIMGSGKNGKSTLINALLGRQAAKENILPETWKIDIFTKALSSDVTFKYKDSKTKQMSVSDAQRILQEEEEKQKESKKNINKQLKAAKNIGLSISELEQKKKELQKYELYHSPITEAIWPIEGSHILDHYRLVDTPGLKQEIDDMVIASAKEYYAKADGVIWVLPGDKIASATDRKEIDELRQMFGNRMDNIIAVVNRIDHIIENGQSVQSVLDEAKRLYGDIFTAFIPLSAKQARQAQEILNNPQSTAAERENAFILLEKSNFPQLIRHLDQVLFSRALEIQLESKTQSISILYQEIQQIAGKADELLRKQHASYRQKMNAWEKDRRDICDIFLKDLQLFLADETKRVHSQAAMEEDYLWNLEANIRNRYILNQIIMPDEIEKRLNLEIQRQSQSLSELCNSHLRRAAFYEFPDLQNKMISLPKDQQKLLSGRFISGDLAGTDGAQFIMGGAIAIGAAAILGPIGLLFAGLAATDIGKIIARTLSRAFSRSLADKITAQFKENIKNIPDKILKEHEKNLNNAEASILKVCNETYANLYGPYEEDKLQYIYDALDSIQKASTLILPTPPIEEVLFSESLTKYRK